MYVYMYIYICVSGIQIYCVCKNFEVSTAIYTNIKCALWEKFGSIIPKPKNGNKSSYDCVTVWSLTTTLQWPGACTGTMIHSFSNGFPF